MSDESFEAGLGTFVLIWFFGALIFSIIGGVSTPVLSVPLVYIDNHSNITGLGLDAIDIEQTNITYAKFIPSLSGKGIVEANYKFTVDYVNADAYVNTIRLKEICPTMRGVLFTIKNGSTINCTRTNPDMYIDATINHKLSDIICVTIKFEGSNLYANAFPFMVPVGVFLWWIIGFVAGWGIEAHYDGWVLARERRRRESKTKKYEDEQRNIHFGKA
jgi:hypothetical protein